MKHQEDFLNMKYNNKYNSYTTDKYNYHHHNFNSISTEIIKITCQFCNESFSIKKNSQYFTCSTCKNSSIIKKYPFQKAFVQSDLINPYFYQKETIKKTDFNNEKYKKLFDYVKEEVEKEKIENDYKTVLSYMLFKEFDRKVKQISRRFYKKWLVEDINNDHLYNCEAGNRIYKKGIMELIENSDRNIIKNLKFGIRK